jgi:hypothetical protein
VITLRSFHCIGTCNEYSDWQRSEVSKEGMTEAVIPSTINLLTKIKFRKQKNMGRRKLQLKFKI